MILFLSFLALAASPGTDIKVFATALVGILLDATLVRALLVPALVACSAAGTGAAARDRQAARVDPSPLAAPVAGAADTPLTGANSSGGCGRGVLPAG